MEITGDLCSFDKTDAQWWKESHVNDCYTTTWSYCCHGDKSLAPKCLCDWWLELWSAPSPLNQYRLTFRMIYRYRSAKKYDKYDQKINQKII